MPAVEIALLIAAAPIGMASATEFTDACVEGGVGLFEAKDCACMDGRVSPGDRSDLVAAFKALGGEMKGREFAMNSAKAMELINKYFNECAK